MAKRLLTAGLVAVGLTGFVMALRRRATRIPRPRHPRNDAARARRARPGRGYDQGPACRGARPVRGAKNSNQRHPERCRSSFRTARPVFRAWPPKQLRRGSDDARNDDAASPRRSPASPGLPELRPCPALCANRSGNARARRTPDLQLPGMQPLDHGISGRPFLVE